MTLMVVLLALSAWAEEAPKKMPVAFFPETTHTFTGVMDGVSVVHDFIVQNKGDAVLKILKVDST